MDNNITLKCKYYGCVICKPNSNFIKFPFNNNNGLIKMGRLILEQVKEKKKHKMISSDTKNHEITINCEKIEIKYKGNSFYTFDLNINKWSCLFSSFKDKKIVLMALALNNCNQYVVHCDVIKITSSRKKLNHFCNLYRKYFIKNNLIDSIISRKEVSKQYENDDDEPLLNNNSDDNYYSFVPENINDKLNNYSEPDNLESNYMLILPSNA